MSVLKYKDPVTGEVKTVGSPSMDGVAKETTSQEILTGLNDAAKETTAQEILNAVGNGSSAVKRIQRGFLPSGQTTTCVSRKIYGNADYSYAVDVNITEVNTTKCVILVDNYATSGEAYIAELVSSTKLRIYVAYTASSAENSTTTRAITWQVIEFN